MSANGTSVVVCLMFDDGSMLCALSDILIHVTPYSQTLYQENYPAIVFCFLNAVSYLSQQCRTCRASDDD